MIQWSYLINSALFIAMVFVAGVVWDHKLAVVLIIACAGMAIACADQLLCLRKNTGGILATVSWAFGIAAVAALFYP